MARTLRGRGLRAALTVAALGTATLMLGGTAAHAATRTATSGATGTAATATCSPGACVPVFLADGTMFGYAVTNPVTGQVILVGPAGNILGVVEQEGGVVDLVGAGGVVLGTFGVDQATGQVIFAPA